jgi:hypothetical protein
MNVPLPTRARLIVALALLALLPAVGCHHVNSTLTPAQQTQLNLYATLNLVVSTDHDIIVAVTGLNKAGTLSTPLTGALLRYADKVNNTSRTALQALNSSQDPAARVLAVVNVLKSLDLPPEVNQFLNSNPTIEAVVNLVNAIKSVQMTITQMTTAPPAALNPAVPAKGATP